MKKRITSFILASAAFMCIQANAQTDSCITNLKTANSNYEMRDFDGAIKLLQSSLSKCNLDRADRIQAHKILALSYLAIDNLEAADREAEAIVKLNPNYVPDKFRDEPRYSALFGKFKPVPVFRLGMNAGINHTSIDVEQTYSIAHNDDDENLGSYKTKTGFQLGLRAEYRIYKQLWFEAAGQFRQSQYTHTLFNVEGTNIHYSEKLSYIDIPVSLKYYYPIENFSPYIEAGVAFSFVTNALGTTTRDELKDIVNRIDYRNNSTTGQFGGLGIAYKLKSLDVYVNFRYFKYPDNVNKDGTRYADLTNVFKYYYIDDDFRMDNWQINAGVQYSFLYKNRKAGK